MASPWQSAPATHCTALNDFNFFFKQNIRICKLALRILANRWRDDERVNEIEKSFQLLRVATSRLDSCRQTETRAPVGGATSDTVSGGALWISIRTQTLRTAPPDKKNDPVELVDRMASQQSSVSCVSITDSKQEEEQTRRL